jgi:hypothetical protein
MHQAAPISVIAGAEVYSAQTISGKLARPARHGQTDVMNPSAIRTQRTPNPNALKFTLDRRVVEGSGSRSFNDPASAAADPVAGPLFQIGDVTGVFMADDFITVIKLPAASWDALTPRVTAVLERVFP